MLSAAISDRIQIVSSAGVYVLYPLLNPIHSASAKKDSRPFRRLPMVKKTIAEPAG
jgi:hypothetical protein